MFERFTDRARSVVMLADQVARENKNNFIAPNHLLIGLMDEGDGIAAQVLTELLIRSDIVSALPPPSDDPLPSHLPFSGDAKKVLELALREALQLGHNYIGTEHVLLGLARLEYENSPLPSLHEVRALVVERLKDRIQIRQETLPEEGEVTLSQAHIELHSADYVQTLAGSLVLNLPVEMIGTVLTILQDAGIRVEINLDKPPS